MREEFIKYRNIESILRFEPGAINKVKYQDIIIRDLLKIPLKVGDKILGITGLNRKIGTIERFEGIYNGEAKVITTEGDEYFSGNTLGINSIIQQNAEYFL